MKIIIDRVAMQTLLIKKGLTYRSFSEKADISLSHFSATMNGHANPGPRFSKKICDFLEVEFDDIFKVESKGGV